MKRILLVLLFFVAGCFEQVEEEIEFNELIITSPAFEHKGSIPSKYTCDGENVNPPLQIDNIPEGTKSLVLLVEDFTFWEEQTHWIVWNINPTNTIGENTVPGVEGTNDFNNQSYTGPCPHSGEHEYLFIVYALDTFLDLESDAREKDVQKAMEGNILKRGSLIGYYCKKLQFCVEIVPLKIKVEKGETADFQLEVTFCNPKFDGTPISYFYASGLDPSMQWHVQPGPDYHLIIETTQETPPGIYWFELMAQARESYTTPHGLLVVTEGQKLPEKHPVTPMAQTSPDSGREWSQFGHDGQYTFFSNTKIPDHLEIVWKYHLEPASEYHYREVFCPLTAPAVFGDRVYFLDFHRLSCLNLRTGNLLYEVPAYAEYPYTPTVADGKVFIAGGRNLFQCLDASTGDTLWERELPNLYLVSPLVDDDAVYVTVDQGGLFHSCLSDCLQMTTEWSALVALDKETGEELWRYSVAGSSGILKGIGFPALADGTIYFYVNYYKSEKSYDPSRKMSYLACLDARTGSLTWKREGILPSSPSELSPFWMTYYSSNLYIGMGTSFLCIDVEAQEPLWEHEAGGLWTRPAVGNGVVVMRNWDRVDCLDAETGEELWTLTVKGSFMPAITENEVFIDANERVYRVDITSGKVTKAYYLGQSVYSPVAARGHVLVAVGDYLTDDYQIVCLGEVSFNKVVPPVVIIVLVGIFLVVRKVMST